MKKIWVFFCYIFSIFAAQNSLGQNGCCSWHGGVAGCGTTSGRQVCRDGTYSPSCLCSLSPASNQVVSTSVPSNNSLQNQSTTTIYSAESNKVPTNPNHFPTNLYCSSIQECEKLATHGDIDAQITLGIVYQGGQGVEKNSNKAIEWYNLASKNSKIKEKSKQFSAWVDNQLAILYWNAGNDDAAAEQATYAAFKGSTLGLVLLGGIYYDERNYPIAFQDFEMAAKFGNSYSQYMLAKMYSTGKGVLQDNVKAYAWVAVAIANGLPKAEETDAISLRGILTEQLGFELIQAKTLAKDFYTKYKYDSDFFR